MTEQLTKRHPIRGFMWGIVFGLGLALLAIGQGYAALGTLPPVILLIAGIVLGTLWGLFAPAKKPKGEPPPTAVDVETVEASKFDDFTDATPTGGVSAAGAVPDAVDEVAGDASDAVDAVDEVDEVAGDASDAVPAFDEGESPSSNDD